MSKTIAKSIMNKKQKKNLYRILVAAALLVLLHLMVEETSPLYLIPYLIVGYDILRKAFKGLINLQMTDENFLMAIATIGAILTGEMSEGVMVMLLYQIGELFQSYAVGKSRKSISDLMDIRPDYAWLTDEAGELVKVDPTDVPVGSLITVKVGERIPLDGVVVEGRTTLNTSALTGESKPREVKKGADVISGCINMTAVIKVETTKEYGESTVAKVLNLVENASSQKSKSEDFITKFARFYTPLVCVGALLLATLPPLYFYLADGVNVFGVWFTRALTFLVISCPCALVISIPLTFFGGIGGASRKGVLVKGSNYLEKLAKVKWVAFDKTGTMTKGILEVSAIHHSPVSDKELLELAAYAECLSTHPISSCILRTYGKHIDKDRVGSVEEFAGMGIKAVVDGHDLLVGNDKLMQRYGVAFIPCRCVGTIVHIAKDGEYMGHLVIQDMIKPNSKKTIADLKHIGITKTVMLTGDEEKTALAIGNELGIDEVYSRLLPDEKVAKFKELLAQKPSEEMAMFVGDGINDAPVIALADVGAAMGTLGSDAAIEAADLVLMDDDPYKIVTAIRCAKKCMGIVYQNIIFAIGIKLLCLLLGALGYASMALAIFADVGVMILAVLNAIRALGVKDGR